jgi:hypothetical protein
LEGQKGREEQNRDASMVAFHAVFMEEFVRQNEHGEEGEQGGERQVTPRSCWEPSSGSGA